MARLIAIPLARSTTDAMMAPLIRSARYKTSLRPLRNVTSRNLFSSRLANCQSTSRSMSLSIAAPILSASLASAPSYGKSLVK
jgi:hypothetical protein